jgi:hypothetical protein
MHSDGTYVGRAAPEIDVFEAQVGLLVFWFEFLHSTQIFNSDPRRSSGRITVRSVGGKFSHFLSRTSVKSLMVLFLALQRWLRVV